MKELIKIFKKQKGFARMSELRKSGIQTRTIAKALHEGIIEKIKPGLYKFLEYPFDENESFASICNADKTAVICLLSASAYYGLTTFNPPIVYVALPNNSPRFNLIYPPVRVYYFYGKKYETGIEEISTGSGKIRIYNREKTIVDLFRYINKLGEDVALESLRTYMREREKRKVNILSEIASQLKIYKKLEPYIKGML